MDTAMIALGIVIGVGFALSLSQWSLWRHRAVSLSHTVGPLQQQLDNAKLQFEAIADERQLHHNTIQETFDYLNEHSPFGSHNDELMELRNTLMNVLKDSTVGRV